MSAKSKLTMLIELQDKLTKPFQKMRGRWEKGIDKMRAKFQTLTAEIPILGRALDMLKNPLIIATAGVLALGATAGKGVAAAEKFDAAFLNIRQLNLDKSKNEMDAFRSKIRDASYDVGANLEMSTNAVYDLQSATGVFGDEAIDIFKKVGRYSIATGADINDAMNSTTKAMKAFGLGVDDIDKLLESNAKTVQTGITTFNELARVQTEYAGATASAGQSVDIGNKVFAMFTSIAKSSDIGANLTKTFFQGLGQQSAKFKEVLSIDVFDKEGMMRDADKILTDISTKFQTMNDQQITEAINLIGGPEGLRSAMDKVKVGADDMIKTFNAFDSSQFSLKDALKNAEGDFGRMKETFYNRLEIVFSKIGEKIIPILADFFITLTPVLDFLYENMEWILPSFATLVGLLGAAKIAMMAFNAATKANILILIISLVIAGVVALAKHTEGWGKLWQNITKMASAAWNGFTANLKLQWLVAQHLILSGIELIMKGWYKLQSLWDKEAAQQGLSKIQNQSDQRLEEIKEQTVKVGTHAKEFLQATKDAWGSVKRKTNKEEEESKEKKKTESLYGTLTGATTTPTGQYSGEEKLSEDITKVTGSAKQVRNITVNIEALNKGGINLKDGETAGLTLQEVEDWFVNSMMKVVRGAELSQG